MQKHKPIIGITHGDINGTNYELLLKIFERDGITELFTPVIYGSPRVAAYYSKALGIDRTPWRQIIDTREIDPDAINITDCCGEDVVVTPGTASPVAGVAALAALERATQDLNTGAIDALVTCPINKSTMPQDLFPYKGHTDYLAVACGKGQEPLMILASTTGLRVALVSTHDPISKVPSVISRERIISKLCILDQSLKQDFRISQPRIAVLALNPHAGDNGLIGREEIEIITPAVKQAREDFGIYAFGPLSADGFWGAHTFEKYDAVLAMYHDQGLSPFKLLHLNDGINFTAGLPVVRTSPDHGTGYDIAMKGVACESALLQSIFASIDLVRNRKSYLEAGANALPNLYRNRGNDSERLSDNHRDE